MQKENKIFLAIILGALIIGGFIYFGIKSDNKVVGFLPPVKNTTSFNVSQIVTKIQKAGNVSPIISENKIVTKVIDGDTVVVEGGYHVRLLGMDADEKGYPCYEPAKKRLEDLVLGKMVNLVKDKTDLDQYGRLLRYIFLDNKNIDEQLVIEGLAVARFYEPDTKYKSEISQAEQQAISGKIGCKWSKN
jgi:micrococcal nuclease